MRSLHFTAVAATVAVLAACHDDPVVAPDPRGEAEPAGSIGIVDPRRGPVHTGYVIGNDGRTPVPIRYQVVNGHAVWDGDVPLGPADRIAATREEALRGGAGGTLFSLHVDADPEWPDGVVPYVVEGTAPSNLLPAMEQIESQAPGINFVPRNGESGYLRVFHHGSVGYHQYYGGYPVRELGLDYTLYPGKDVLMHELGHVLGFGHEHQRCDRDSYIDILDTSAAPSQFELLCGWVKIGGYDFSSIMHYNSWEFGDLHFTDWYGNTIQGYHGRTTISSGDASAWQSVYPGSSSSGYTVLSGGPYPARTGPNTGYSSPYSLASGTTVSIVCTMRGNDVTGPYGTTDLWNRLGGAHDGEWMSDAHIYTGTSEPVAGACDTVAATGTIIDGPLNQRTGPGTGYDVVGTVAKDTKVGIVCTARGTSVTGPYGTTDLWNRLDSGYWVTDAYVYTGTNDAVAPACP